VHILIVHCQHINISFEIDIFLKKFSTMNFKLAWELVSKDLWIVYFLLVSNYIDKVKNLTLFHFIFENKMMKKLLHKYYFMVKKIRYSSGI
jgi:hypothetical protein